MTILLYANNAQTTLASDLNNSATTCTLAAGTGALFPTPGAGQAFYATLANAPTPSTYEIVLVTGRSGDTLTIVRGQDGTSAASWLTGDFVEMLPTRGTMNNLIQIDQLQNGAYYKVSSVAGTGNAITATLASNFTALFDGLSILLTAGAANTGAATLNLTLGSTATGATAIVKGNNSPLVAGDIPGSGYPVELVYSSGYAKWVLQNPAVTNSATSQSDVTYIAAGGTANAITATYSPAVAAVSDGLKLRFKAANANTGAATFSPNGLTARPILNQFGLALTSGAIQSGSEVEVTYNSSVTSWIMTVPVSDVLSSGNMNTLAAATNISMPSGAWRSVEVDISNLTAATAYVLFVQFNTDTGNNYFWSYQGASNGNNIPDFGVNVGGIALTRTSSSAVGTGASNPVDITFKIANPASVINHNVSTIPFFYFQANGVQNSIMPVGRWNGGAAITSIQIGLYSTLASTPTGSLIAASTGTWTLRGTY